MPNTNLILGLAAGYHYGDVRPFLLSLEQSGCWAEVVLFVSDTTRDLDRIGRHRVIIVPLQRPSGLEELPYNALRYWLYRQYLEESAVRYGSILLTDLRDVVFQRDPFSFPWSGGLNCVLEDRRMTIGRCPHNAHWVATHQGREALGRIADQPISCSGTTVGDHDATQRYLEIMLDRLLPFDGGERIAGYDQGVHNMLVHTGMLDNLTLHDNAGPVVTLGHTVGEPAIDDEGFVLNESGERAHLVHQYDRKPNLFSAFRARFA